MFRKIHYWGAIIIALPLVITIGAGIILMLKKDIAWIQPSTQQGIERTAIPMASINDLFLAAKAVEQAGFTTWNELVRADFKPGKGVVKFISQTDWEVQIDTHTAEVLQVAQRRSDLIESIHDGSYFGDWTKLWIFLPAGVILFVLWISGMYLFIITELAKVRKRKRLRR